MSKDQIVKMEKGVAIPYVIALIIGIVVVGVIGYWFFGLAGKGTGVQATINCDAIKLSFCQEWSSTGYSRPVVFNEWDNVKCPGKPSDQPDSTGKKPLVEFCKSLLGAQ